MTVAELIEALKQFPPDAEVYSYGRTSDGMEVWTEEPRHLGSIDFLSGEVEVQE